MGDVPIKKWRGNMKKHRYVIIGGAVVIILVLLLRVYYGGGVGLRIVFKGGPAFKDTVVNVDDMRVIPRIALASNHPAVKRQLEKMGIFEDDALARERIKGEMTKDLKKLLRDIAFLTTYYLDTSASWKVVETVETEEKS